MLEISNLYFARGNSLILKDINMSVLPSNICLIKGPNGKGKSTLLSCMAGLLEPMKGSLLYFSDLVDINLASKKFIFIGEENFAYEELTILQNIHYWLCINGVTPNAYAIERSVTYLYGQLDIKKKFLHLSFGQKRKMRMLLLMLIDRPVWILDDPFNGLDQESINKLSRIITMKRNQNGMVIIATHITPEITDIKEYELL